MPDESDRTEFLWNTHSYLSENIRFADTKAELVIGWTSALMGVLVAAEFHKTFLTGGALGYASTLGFALLALSFAFAFFAVLPRLKTTQSTGFIYWKNIRAHKSAQGYATTFGNEANLNGQLAHHLYDLAKICDRKFWLVGGSVVLAFVGSAVCGITYMLLHPAKP